MIREMRTIWTTSSAGRLLWSRLSGAERQRWRHREARLWVRVASLVERRATISPRTASGRSLMRSTPAPSSPLPKPSGDSWQWDSFDSLIGWGWGRSAAAWASGGCSSCGDKLTMSSDFSFSGVSLLFLARGAAASVSMLGGSRTFNRIDERL
uniref:Uncharacterized protein n=1 Tax=Arundo donax TaxID=35708 RepID=A0A0A8ZAB3_ARUDO